MEAPMICRWQTEDGMICGHPISVARTAEHLAMAHGTSGIAAGFTITCRWCPDRGRAVKRANMVRHVRECHLHVPRRVSRSPRDLPC
ncbi:hypothetical protein V8E55_007437 [Tylopilus felleus]